MSDEKDIKPGAGIVPADIKEEMIDFMHDELGWQVRGNNPALAHGIALMFEKFAELLLEKNRVDVMVGEDPGVGKFK